MVSNRVMINEDKKKIFVGFLFAMLLAISMIVLHERSITKQSHIGFTLYAYFNKIDGVANGVEVRLGGLKVGRVVSQTFAKDYQIVDSSVQIETDGLMGPKHIEIVPGADDELLRDGDAFGYTQDVMILNDLLEKVVAYMRDKKGVTDEEESN